MTDLELAADLLGCYIVTNNKGSFALFDLDTGKQCSEFYTLDHWSRFNHADIMLCYLNHK